MAGDATPREAETKLGPDRRLSVLDGFRGVAILLVMGHHYFHRFVRDSPSLYPYGDAFANFVIFKYGYFGVDLFFIVSGFVIAMTLENSQTIKEFAVKRFARIWPTLAICAVFTFLVVTTLEAPLLNYRPQRWENFIPSLTLTWPTTWSPEWRFVDGAYWTLVVEARFYLYAAIIYYFSQQKRLHAAMLCFACAVTIAHLFERAAIGSRYTELMLIAEELPWFTAGTVFYAVYKDRISRNGALLYLLILLMALISMKGLVYSIEIIPFFTLFWLFAIQSKLVLPFSSPALVWVGLCSYSVYLLHQEIGVSIISLIPQGLPIPVAVSLVLVVALGIIGLGWASFVFVETTTRRAVLNWLR